MNIFDAAKEIFGEMRNSTKEEREVMSKMLDEKSIHLGVNIFDLLDGNVIFPCQKAMLDQIAESFHPAHTPTNSYWCTCDFLEDHCDVWLPEDWEYVSKEQEKEEINKRMSKLIVENCNKYCKYIK
jgi:hypothetical protein